MEKYHRVHYWRLPIQTPWAPIWPLSIGWMRCDRPVFKVRQGYFCINLVVQGKLSYSVNHQSPYVLQRGDLYITGPDDTFRYVSEERIPGQYAQIYWLRLTGPFVEAWFELLGFSETVHVLKNRKADFIESLFKVLIDLAHATPTKAALETVATLYKLAAAIETSTRPFEEQVPLSDVVLDFMRNELDHGININQLCDIFDISRTALYNTFKRQLNKSPHEALKDIQTEKALALLTETEIPLEEVALSCGLSSYLQLSRLIKNKFGMTPKAFRSKNRHQDVND